MCLLLRIRRSGECGRKCWWPKLTVRVGEIRVTVVHSRLAVLDPVPGSGFSPYGRAIAGHTAQLFALTGGHGRIPRRTACEKNGNSPHTLRPYRPCPPGLTAPPARLGPPGDNSPCTGRPGADDRGSCKGPPPDCRRIVIRLRSGIKRRSDRRATSTGQSAWSTYTQIGT